MIDLFSDLSSPGPEAGTPPGAPAVSPGETSTTTPAGIARFDRDAIPARKQRSVVRPGTCHPLYVDIETAPDESRLDLFGLDPLPPAAADKDMPSPEEFRTQSLEEIRTIFAARTPSAAWLERLAAAEAAQAKPRKGLTELIAEVAAKADERRKLLSVTPEFCRIVALGLASGEEAPQALVVGVASRGEQPETEKSLLDAFWFAVKSHGAIVGYNIAGFDLPTIYVRSALLGIDPPKSLISSAPWKGDVVDLMQVRFARGPARKLKDLARAYGIPIPAGEVDGSCVADLFARDPATLAKYVASDVAITREVHRLYQGFFCY